MKNTFSPKEIERESCDEDNRALVPKGRDEADLPWPMAWVGHRDRYDHS
jgi:hypothetical protein